MAAFKLTLHPTYFAQGFFNVPVDYDRFVRSTEEPITIQLGASSEIVQGRVNRTANQIGTARIMGGSALKDWFQSHCKVREQVYVIFTSPEIIPVKTNRDR